MSPVMIPTFVFDALAFAGTVLIIAGVIALVVGLFGARGFHDVGLKARPQCARCSYDLRSTMSPAGTCPECGADLSTPDAVVVAQRRVRWKLVVLGMVLLACAGLAAWKLDAKGRTALRSALAEMSSTRANLDALVTDGDAAPFAQRARLGGFGGRCGQCLVGSIGFRPVDDGIELRFFASHVAFDRLARRGRLHRLAGERFEADQWRARALLRRPRADEVRERDQQAGVGHRRPQQRTAQEHHGQNRAVKASRSVNGSTGWKCTSSTGPASPGNCEP